MSHVTVLPKPEVKGEGTVMYRCAECGGLMTPEDAEVRTGKSYHRQGDDGWPSCPLQENEDGR